MDVIPAQAGISYKNTFFFGRGEESPCLQPCYAGYSDILTPRGFAPKTP